MVGDAEVFEGDFEVVGDGWFGDFAEDEGADGDAELAGGEVDGEVGYGAEDSACSGVAVGDEVFDAVTAGGDEGEFGGDEEGVANEEGGDEGDGGDDSHGFSLVWVGGGGEEYFVDAAVFHGEDGSVPGGWRWGGVVGWWECEFVAGFGDASEVVHDESAEGFVGAFGGEVSEVFFEFVEADEAGDGPGAGGVLVEFLLLFFVVVFVVDVAEDFFDDVFDGDEAGGAAVFVFNEDDLGAGGADGVEDSVAVEGFGDGVDGVGDAA